MEQPSMTDTVNKQALDWIKSLHRMYEQNGRVDNAHAVSVVIGGLESGRFGPIADPPPTHYPGTGIPGGVGIVCKAIILRLWRTCPPSPLPDGHTS